MIGGRPALSPSSPEMSSEEKEDGDPMVMAEIAMEEADEEPVLALVEPLVIRFSLLQAEQHYNMLLTEEEQALVD